jgi:hypothetical protein
MSEKIEFNDQSSKEGTAEVIKNGVMLLVEQGEEVFCVPSNEVNWLD